MLTSKQSPIIKMTQRAATNLVRARLDAWMQLNSGDPLAMTNINTMLQSEPEREPVVDLLPKDDYQQRLELAKKFTRFIQVGDPDYKITAPTLVTFFILPLKPLRNGTRSVHDALLLQNHLGFVVEASIRCQFLP